MNVCHLAFLLLFQFSFAYDQAPELPQSSLLPNDQQDQKSDKAGAANIIFESTDGGQTWQDISQGLPENLQGEGIQRDSFSANDTGLYLRAGNGVYHRKPNSTDPSWKREFFSGDRANGWEMKSVESNGILMATRQNGIVRSTDGGKNWECVLNEGGVGIAVESIEGGFAAITYNTESKTRRVRTSYDGGESWQPIDAGLPASLSIASIIQVGEYFFCGHPAGIYRSSDEGKTWELLLPSIEDKVFNLSVSCNAIYAIPRNGGC